MTDRPCFHLAIPVDDIAAAREFYGGVLGLTEGRSADVWIDWNFYGHQVVTHQVPVHWDEYFEVSNSARVLVKETAAPGEAASDVATDSYHSAMPAAFAHHGIDAGRAVLRRSILSAVLPG